MGPQRHRGIYIGFDSPSIIRYLEPTTTDIFRARYHDCQFWEDIFPTLSTVSTPNPLHTSELQWQTKNTFWHDPRTSLVNDEVKRILNLHQIMEQLPDGFNDASQVTKSHVEAANTPARIAIEQQPATYVAPKAKRGRSPGSKNRTPRDNRPTPVPTTNMLTVPLQNNNEEISPNYANTGNIWTRNDVDTNESFTLLISQTISIDSTDPKTVNEAQQQSDWPLWENAINSELDSLIARQVFGKLIQPTSDINLTGYRIIVVRKRNAEGVVVRHKARLVAKGYTHIWGQDYDLTYAPVMDAITYRYLIAFSLIHKLKLHLLDVVTAYLYGTLDTTIYMQAPPKLLQRLNFHIQGEKNAKLSPDVEAGINNIVPTNLQRQFINCEPEFPYI